MAALSTNPGKSTPSEDDFNRITAGVPNLTQDQVQEVLRTAFGVADAALQRLSGETDLNYRVTATDGAEFVFKATDDLATAEFQAAMLCHVADTDAKLPVPRLLPTVDGKSVYRCRLAEQDLAIQLLTWLPGNGFGETTMRSEELLADLGTIAGRLTASTASMSRPPRMSRYWDIARSGEALSLGIPFVADEALRRVLDGVRRWLATASRQLDTLPRGVVHGDLNTLNVLVERVGHRQRVSGLIDFGDALETWRVADLAILLATVMRSAESPVREAAQVARAYHAACPLTEAELDVVYPLALVRLSVVAVTAARLQNEGFHGKERNDATELARQLIALEGIPYAEGRAAIRFACGLAPHPSESRATNWLKEHADQLAPIVGQPLVAIDLTAASEVFDGLDPQEPEALQQAARSHITQLGPSVAVGCYGEARFLHARRRVTGANEWDNMHLGVELFVDAGSTVTAPITGVVQPNSACNLDIVLRHEPEVGNVFYSLYRGLHADVAPGDTVPTGGRLGSVGTPLGESSLPAAVTVQLAVEPVGEWTAVPSCVAHSDFPYFAGLFPDATALLSGGDGIAAWEPAIGRTLVARAERLPPNHPTYFEQPINMVRARGTWFYDELGRGYLDSLNNVTLVGHCHPRLLRAVNKQSGRLNTNSRFVYDGLTRYADALTETLPAGLDVVYFVNSGSEANDLALRMAQFVTGRRDLVIIDDAYHGNTALVTEITPARYKLSGKPPTTHATAVPDRYRGLYGYDDPAAGAKYAQHVIDTFDRLIERGTPPAAFVFEALLASAGQIVLPPGYLQPIFEAARERGILTLADEVQVGFGRLGEAFWGFQTQGPLVPDMVTLGKSMGNGYPVAALVTTKEIAAAFTPTGRFFSTYGGNPVACAVGLELLQILEEEDLQRNAFQVGEYFRNRLSALADRHELIGDVRGQGFYSGVEFVLDRVTKEPAAAETLRICERLKDEGVLVYPTGPHWNVLKLKPPLTFGKADADLFVATLDLVLTRGW